MITADCEVRCLTTSRNTRRRRQECAQAAAVDRMDDAVSSGVFPGPLAPPGDESVIVLSVASTEPYLPSEWPCAATEVDTCGSNVDDYHIDADVDVEGALLTEEFQERTRHDADGIWWLHQQGQQNARDCEEFDSFEDWRDHDERIARDVRRIWRFPSTRTWASSRRTRARRIGVASVDDMAEWDVDFVLLTEEALRLNEEAQEHEHTEMQRHWFELGQREQSERYRAEYESFVAWRAREQQEMDDECDGRSISTVTWTSAPFGVEIGRGRTKEKLVANQESAAVREQDGEGWRPAEQDSVGPRTTPRHGGYLGTRVGEASHLGPHRSLAGSVKATEVGTVWSPMPERTGRLGSLTGTMPGPSRGPWGTGTVWTSAGMAKAESVPASGWLSSCSKWRMKTLLSTPGGHGPLKIKRRRVRVKSHHPEFMLEETAGGGEVMRDAFSWVCSVCACRVYAPTAALLSRRRRAHWLRAHKELPKQEIVPTRLPMTVPCSTSLLPLGHEDWSCPLCDENLPMLGGSLRMHAMRKHVQDKHPGITPRMLQSIRMKMRHGRFAQFMRDVRERHHAKAAQKLQDEVGPGHDVVLVPVDPQGPAPTGKRRRVCDGMYFCRNCRQRLTYWNRARPCQGLRKAHGSMIRWWRLHRSGGTAVPQRMAEAFRTSIEVLDRWYAFVERHQLVVFQARHRQNRGAPATSSFSICFTCRHRLSLRTRQQPCEGRRQATKKECVMWRRHRQRNTPYVLALSQALRTSRSELDTWFTYDTP